MRNIEGKKYCPRCKRKLTFDKFNKSKSTRNGLSSYCKICNNKFRPKKYITGKLQYCIVCKQNLSIESFNTNKKTLSGLSSYCKLCNSNILRNHHQNNILKYMLKGAHLRSRNKNLPIDIDLEWLEQRYTGRCELTNIEFQYAIKGKSPISPSLDRIDNSKGYTKDNVRIIIWALNASLGQWGEETYERISKAYWNEQGYILTKKE